MWRGIFATLIVNNLLMVSSVSAEATAYVSVDSCRILTRHIPTDDVVYKPGIDVRGRPVTPANLSPAPDFGLKDKISFHLILDVAEEARGNADTQRQFQDHPGLEGRVGLGLIEIKQGEVTLDGKPLASQHQIELTEFCKKSRKQP